ncbi:hypothetical protein [Streptomyces sp. NPDC048473]|uniref:hypothetical protein n=1 Tax=unclassified Streptomyces TaxID=2593676 RepID=UPI00371DC869
MPSAPGLLEAKESAAREAVVRVWEEAARIAAVLDEAERALERLVIAREAVVQVLAEPSVQTVDVAKDRAGTAMVTAAVAGSPVPRGSEHLTSGVLAADYQRIMSALEAGAVAGRGGMRAKEPAAALGLEQVPAKIEGVRSRARRLSDRGWITRHHSGEFSALPACGGAFRQAVRRAAGGGEARCRPR